MIFGGQRERATRGHRFKPFQILFLPVLMDFSNFSGTISRHKENLLQSSNFSVGDIACRLLVFRLFPSWQCSTNIFTHRFLFGLPAMYCHQNTKYDEFTCTAFRQSIFSSAQFLLPVGVIVTCVIKDLYLLTLRHNF